VSQAKHWCEYCKIFISGSKPSIAFHDNGRKHKEIVELFMRDMRQRGRERRADEKDLNREMEKIEQEAMKQYLKEDARGPRSDAGSASGSGAAGGSASGSGVDRVSRMAELDAKIKAARQLTSGSAGPPPGWRVQANPDGRFYYVNQSTGETSWENPSHLSASTDQSAPEPATGVVASSALADAGGWQCGYSPKGVPYYYHVGRGITQWEAPPEWVAVHGAVGMASGSAGAAAACSSSGASGASVAVEPHNAEGAADGAPAEGTAAVVGTSESDQAAEEGAEEGAAEGIIMHGEAGTADGDIETEPSALASTESAAASTKNASALTESAAVDEATGLGQWTVVEPAEIAAREQKKPMKRPRGFADPKLGDDDDENKHDMVAHVKSHYAVPEVIRRAAAEVEASVEGEGAPAAEAVVFKKRNKSRAGFRNSKTA
jgi:WW domain-binding protein 4